MKEIEQNHKPARLNNKVQNFRHGLFLSLSHIDERTKLGKACKLLHEYLHSFVGESTIVTELLISRIVYKSIKCFMYENTDIKKKVLDESVGKLYLSYTNSLRCDLAELNRLASAPREQDLMSYLKENYQTSK